MSDFKEFQGKTLDIAIDSACDYFNCEREKLEIMLLEDAKTGVFGLFGTRDAKISAKKADFFYNKADSVFENSYKKKHEEQKAKPSHKNSPKNETKQISDTKTDAKEENKPVSKSEQKPLRPEKPAEKPVEKPAEKPAEKPVVLQNEHKEENRAKKSKELLKSDEAKEYTSSSLLPFESLDQELVLESAKTVVNDLISFIVDDATIASYINGERLCVSIETESSGLLIGKEGQTLASIEYLAARMLIKKLNAHVRVQVEVGDYRSRQDSRLQEFALKLAERTRETGKSTSTRPLSSYQRRIVHLALQDMTDIQTRSIDEGPLKRVIISLAKERH